MSGLVGSRAPAARLPGLDGAEVEIPGTAPLTLLVFLKASCPTCAFAAPFLQNLHARAKGLLVLGIASDTAADARSFAEGHGLRFPIAVESAPWETSAAYGLTTVPTLVLLGPDGFVEMFSEGFARDDFLAISRRAAEVAGGAAVSPFPDGEAVPAFRPG
jgi:peroxiredoxin